MSYKSINCVFENDEGLYFIQKEVINLLLQIDLQQLFLSSKSVEKQLFAAITEITLKNAVPIKQVKSLNFGQEALKNITLSAIDKKEIKKAIIDSFQKKFIPVSNFWVAKQNENSFNIFSKDNKADILALERRISEKKTRLASIKLEKCKLIKLAAEIKADSMQCYQIQHLCKTIENSNKRASLLQNTIAHEICFKTDHCVKALKKAQGFMDAKLQ